MLCMFVMTSVVCTIPEHSPSLVRWKPLLASRQGSENDVGARHLRTWFLIAQNDSAAVFCCAHSRIAGHESCGASLLLELHQDSAEFCYKSRCAMALRAH